MVASTCDALCLCLRETKRNDGLDPDDNREKAIRGNIKNGPGYRNMALMRTFVVDEAAMRRILTVGRDTSKGDQGVRVAGRSHPLLVVKLSEGDGRA